MIWEYFGEIFSGELLSGELFTGELFSGEIFTNNHSLVIPLATLTYLFISHNKTKLNLYVTDPSLSR